MIKVNTMDTDGLFQKGFAKTAFSSDKNKFQTSLTKKLFLRYLTYFLKEAVKVLTFAISVGSSDIFEFFLPGVNDSKNYFRHINEKQASRIFFLSWQEKYFDLR